MFVLQDIRHALRTLRRSPSFTATAVGTLALSVALSTALFATVDAIFFRPLSVQAPEELVYLYWTPGQVAPRPAVLPRKSFEFFGDTPEAFSGVAGHLMWNGRVTASGVAETLNGELAGRDFDERDTLDRRKVAIVSQAVADRLWPGGDPIDRSVAVLSPFASSSAQIESRQVIGVVNEISPLFREHGSAPFVYLPISQKWDPWVSYVLARVDGNPADAAQLLKQEIAGADALADVHRIQTVDQMLGDLLYTRRLAATVLGAGAMIAMALALVGLYAVVSYSVSRRVHELGVRAVLGADRAALVWFVTREALAIAVIGCDLGLTLAHVTIGATASLFEGMPRLDILTASAMLLALGALVGVAAYVPARHAARIDPMEALRAL